MCCPNWIPSLIGKSVAPSPIPGTTLYAAMGARVAETGRGILERSGIFDLVVVRFRSVVLKPDVQRAMCRCPSESCRAARARVSARSQGSEACDCKANGVAREAREVGRKAN